MLRRSLVLGVVFLLISVIIIPISANNIEPTFMQSSNSNKLYVGGSGPGNYTKIQDAIDDATDGDTVFVYDDSSPYHENVKINKRIALVGEDKNTTIIHGDGVENVVRVNSDWVNISGFTIQNGGKDGIFIDSNYNTINDNIISNNKYSGIWLSPLRCNNNKVINNLISSNTRNGIGAGSSLNHHNIYLGNIILNNDIGINLMNAEKNTITENNISKNGMGIYLQQVYCDNNIISFNTISSNNEEGMYLYVSDKNIISDNCFLNDGLYIYSSYQNTLSNNTVNGKPLVYLEDECDMIIDDDAGQVILINCEDITIKNQELYNTDAGIQLLNTNNCLISDNTFSSDDHSGRGIHLYDSRSNTISSNKILNGIKLWRSDYNNITGNNISANSGHGIEFEESSFNNISNNHISNNKENGIFLYFLSQFNNIKGNTIIYNKDGITIGDGSCHNTITGNILNSNKRSGILIDGDFYLVSENKVINNNISNNHWGIICESYPNTIEKNNFIGNKRQATTVFKYENIWDNNYWDNWIGIRFKLPIFQIFPKIIWGGFLSYTSRYSFIPCAFDRNPAKEPYDMGGVKYEKEFVN